MREIILHFYHVTVDSTDYHIDMENTANVNSPERDLVKVLFKILCESELHIFPGRGMVKASERKGVYIIYASNGEVIHVGGTPSAEGGIRQRLYNHLVNGSSFSRVYISKHSIVLRGCCMFRYVEVEDPRMRALLEHFTIGSLCPLHIGTGDKKKAAG